jgi:hypothetical protein
MNSREQSLGTPRLAGGRQPEKSGGSGSEMPLPRRLAKTVRKENGGERASGAKTRHPHPPFHGAGRYVIENVWQWKGGGLLPHDVYEKKVGYAENARISPFIFNRIGCWKIDMTRLPHDVLDRKRFSVKMRKNALLFSAG